MKKLLFLLATMLIVSGMWAQCPTGNVTLSSQQQINNFAATYPNCTEVAGWLRIIDGDDISDLSPLSNITSIGDYLRIFYTSNLVSLTGLENLTSIGTGLRIIGNTALTDITALSNEITGITGLTINGNSQLSVCSTDLVCELIANGVEVTTNQNAPGCTNVTETQIDCIAPPGVVCFTGNINITTQQEIDDFASNYPGCEQILGQLRIRGTTPDAITNLNGLSQLEVIRGNLIIVANNLTNFTGLDNLTFVGGELKISDNDGISNLTELDNLNFVFGNLNIDNNNLLADLSGLENLTHTRNLNIDTNTSLTSLIGLDNLTSSGNIRIQNNNNLTSIAALSNINNPLSILSISDNDALTSLNGLENITSNINNLHVNNNNSLVDISALNNITQVGYLSISGNNNLVSLTGLNNLASSTLDIYISDNASLTDLSGLENLSSINGALTLRGNAALMNIEGLSNLSSVSNVFISNNTVLNSLVGLESISSVKTLNIENNDALTNLEGLDNINTVGLKLTIFDNDALVDITVLSNLNTVGSGLQITGHPLLASLNGLENLSSIGTDLWIEANPLLTNLDPLANINTIGGFLRVADNTALTDIQGIQNIAPNGITDLYIYKNTNLSFCELSNICTYLENPNTTGIYDNATDCNSSSEILNACNAPDPICPPGNIMLSTQEDVDDFPINYPGCTVIDGNVIIGDYITNLSGLNQITTINGNLGFLSFPSVVDFSGLENLETIGGNLNINYLSGLNSFGGLESLNSIGGDLTVEFNDDLTSFTGLENLASIGGNLTIDFNNGLTSLTGLEGLISISGNLKISNTAKLQNLNGLNALTTVGGDFELLSNSDLTEISALNNLTSIGGFFNVEINDKLTNLSGLENLNTVGGTLKFFFNNQLTSLSAIENLDHTTITNLIIDSNSKLSICGVTSICNYLAAEGMASISGNATGCATQPEVESACTNPPCGADPVSEDITHIFDEDLFIDGVGFTNNSNITFSNSAIPNGAALSDASLELYFRLNGSSCENEIAIQLTDPAGNTQALSAFAACDGGTGLYYVNLDITNVNATSGVNNWLIEFDDTNDQNADYEYSVRFARLKYTSTTLGSTAIVNEVSDFADSDLFIDGVGFANNGTYTFTDPGTPADATLSDISLELYFRLNGASCENEIALQITDPAGNSQALTAYTSCDGGTGLYYVNLDVPSGSTTGSTADWVVEFDDTNDQNADYEYSVRFGRLTYTTTQTMGGVGGIPVTVNEQISDFADADLFIDAVGFTNNGTYTFTDPGTPADGVLSNISLELYFRLNGTSCENEIALQLTDPAGNTQALTAYTTCDGGNGLFYVNLNVPSGSTSGSVADWVLEFDDTNDQNADYEYSVRFGRLTYDVEYTECVPMLVNENDEAEQINTPSTQQGINSNTTRPRQHNSIKLYPVPASQHLNVEYFSEMNHSTNIQIISNTGKTLLQKELISQEGINATQLDISNLPAGHYHIRMYNTDGVQTQTFIKIAP